MQRVSRLNTKTGLDGPNLPVYRPYPWNRGKGFLPTRRETFRYLTNSHLDGFLVDVPKTIPPLELELVRK